MSLALTDRVFTSEPPGKPRKKGCKDLNDPRNKSRIYFQLEDIRPREAARVRNGSAGWIQIIHKSKRRKSRRV